MNEVNRIPRLSKRDAEILDTIAEGGFDPARIEELQGEDRARAEAIMELLENLEQYPVDDASEDLVAATLARINRAEEERADRMQVGGPESAGGQLSGRRWRFPDLFATAAMILLAVGVIWPIANTVQSQRMVSLDASNLSENHRAITTYANANSGRSPMEEVASLLPDPFEWLGKDSGSHNDAIRTQLGDHASVDDFHRPEGDPIEHAYSFQLWNDGDDLLVADRPIVGNTNPLPGMGVRILMAEADLPSGSHGDMGQNILYGDGTVELHPQSIIDGDLIWAPEASTGGLIIEIIRGGDRGKDLIFLLH